MSTITIHKCDRCGTEQPDRKGLYAVGCQIGNYHGWEDAYKHFSADWCKKCAIEVGFPPEPQPKQDAPVSSPTMEDMIRLIIQQEMR